MRERLAPAAERGHLEVRPRVVDRVGRRAAIDVDGVVRGTVGRVHRHDLPEVSSRVDAGRVRLSIDIAVAWGRPLTEVATQVQRAVTDQVTRLTGMTVDSVDVTVDSVVVPHEPSAARVS